MYTQQPPLGSNQVGKPQRQRSYSSSQASPSHTVIPPTPLTIHEMTEFVSTMIYILWHRRRSSVMALHSASSQQRNAHMDNTHLLINQGDTVSMLKGSNSAFRRFCQQVLTVTQLSESVVILSLKYIAKLLQKSPHIQGAEGSEYRLFIVALMLANKFHDDNTYTNKTWSDVSGMKLYELDIMELEFLFQIDFGLFIPRVEFDSWRIGLLTFMAELKNATVMNKQHEQLIDSTLRRIGLSLPDPTWNASNNNILTQQQQQEQQNQQYLYLLYATAQPEFREQVLKTPLTRVPLRIPPPYTMSSSGTQPIAIPTSSTPSAASASSLTSSLTPIDAMYHQPPPSQLYTNDATFSFVEPSFYSRPPHETSSTQLPPLTFPAPVRTSSRSLPRNAANSSLTCLLHSNNPYYNNNNESQQQYKYAHYQRPMDDLPMMDACNKYNHDHLTNGSQSNPSQYMPKPCGPLQQQPQHQQQ
ncbi:cyclin-domain-containing protein [Chlamydoabsidia padenii]|nr:cyclin-domain-containing protein [Chlamydoabsidia padenii]